MNKIFYKGEDITSDVHQVKHGCCVVNSAEYDSIVLTLKNGTAIITNDTECQIKDGGEREH